MTIDDGGQAFPAAWPDQCPTLGMSLRDWLAGQALIGLLPVCAGDTIPLGMFPQHIAKNAYSIADAMLAERDR